MIAKGNMDPWFFLGEYKWSFLPVGITYLVVFYVANLYDHHQYSRRHENFSRVILFFLVGTFEVARPEHGFDRNYQRRQKLFDSLAEHTRLIKIANNGSIEQAVQDICYHLQLPSAPGGSNCYVNNH